MRLFFLVIASIAGTYARPYVSLHAKKRKRCFDVSQSKGMSIDVHYDFFGDKNAGKVQDRVKVMLDDDVRPTRDITTLTDFSGKIKYKINSTAQNPRVCFHAEYIRNTAVYVSIKLSESASVNVNMFDDQVAGAKIMGRKSVRDEHKESSLKEENVKRELSSLERAVLNLGKEAEHLLSNSVSRKEQEYEFYEHSMKMNASAKWWPIAHLVVLVVTGYAQAKYMVNFFKSQNLV